MGGTRQNCNLTLKISTLWDKIVLFATKFSAQWEKIVIHLIVFPTLWNKIVVHITNSVLKIFDTLENFNFQDGELLQRGS